MANRTGTALGGGIATVLALTGLAAPAPAASTVPHSGTARGSLVVCVDGMGGRSFSVELAGPSARTRDVSNLQRCTSFQGIRTGNYMVTIRPLGSDCVVRDNVRRVQVRADDVRTLTFDGGCFDRSSRDPNHDPHSGGGGAGPNGPDGRGPNGPRGAGGTPNGGTPNGGTPTGGTPTGGTPTGGNPTGGTPNGCQPGAGCP